MRSFVFVIVAIIVSGCFVPPEEDEHDGGVEPILDAGVDAGTDAGVVRVDCGGSRVAFILFPEGCTHFKGELGGGVGANGPIIDSDSGMLSTLAEVDGRLLVEFAMIENIRGLGRLERVSGPFDFSSSIIRSVSAGQRVREVGSLVFTYVRGLEDIELSNLEVIHGDLYLTNNADLRTLAGLRSLRIIEGKLFHGANPKLLSTELRAFTSRVSIDGGIERL
jgi:hypothetical protein